MIFILCSRSSKRFLTEGNVGWKVATINHLKMSKTASLKQFEELARFSACVIAAQHGQ